MRTTQFTKTDTTCWACNSNEAAAWFVWPVHGQWRPLRVAGGVGLFCGACAARCAERGNAIGQGQAS